MNRMLLILLLTGLTYSWASAQGGTHKIKTSAKKVVFSVDDTDLIIEGHNSAEVIITTDDYEEPPERAKGLRPLYTTGQDNTGIGLEVKETGGVLQVSNASNESMEYVIKVPKGMNIQVEELSWQSGDVTIKNIDGEIELKCKGADIELENVSGPIVANTTSGDITVVFSKVNQNQPTSISNVSGFIDVTLPAATKANFMLKSVTGEVYTDLNLDLGEKKGLRRTGGGQALKGAFNGGGVEISLNTISDDIYLRKQ